MNAARADEIRANLERAQLSLEAAEELMNKEFVDFAVSRAYYGVFYAASAALARHELTYGKHGGVIAAVHREFVKSGKLEDSLGKDLNWLFELRNTGDYGVAMHVPREDAEKALAVARDLVSALAEIAAE